MARRVRATRALGVAEELARRLEPQRHELREDARVAELALGDMRADRRRRSRSSSSARRGPPRRALARGARLRRASPRGTCDRRDRNDGLDDPAEPRRHAAGEDDLGDFASPERVDPGLAGVVAGIARRRSLLRSSASGGSTAPRTTSTPATTRPAPPARRGPRSAPGRTRSARGHPQSRVDLVDRHPASDAHHGATWRTAPEDALLGDDRRDELGRRDVEGRVAGGEACRDLARRRAPRSGCRRPSPSPGRTSRSARRCRTGSRDASPSTASP